MYSRGCIPEAPRVFLFSPFLEDRLREIIDSFRVKTFKSIVPPRAVIKLQDTSTSIT